MPPLSFPDVIVPGSGTGVARQFISSLGSGGSVRGISMTRDGIVCYPGENPVRLDPKRAGSGLSFVSHAHTDHLPSSCTGTVLASRYTAQLASLRGYDLGECVEKAAGLELHDSGHILGSKGLLAGDIFYTGDMCTRDRGFLRGARVPRCRTLVTECTFGLPEFRFPPVHEVRSQVDELIAAMYSRGVPVVLMGYELGKAQVISQMFAHWEPMYYHDSVKRVNDMHRRLGVALKPAPGHTEAQGAGLLDKKPWVMVAPMMGPKTAFASEMRRYGAVTVSFSGWANSSRFSYSRGADYFVTLSDHCDFAELVAMVEASGAEQVYTVHGFVSEFAEHLRGMGISAEPLERPASGR